MKNCHLILKLDLQTQTFGTCFSCLSTFTFPMELLHDVDGGDDSCGDKNPNFHTSVFSHRMVTAWCSTFSSSAGRPTGTRLSLNAPSSSWSGGWPSGRSSMMEETGGLWYTACKFNVHTQTHTCRFTYSITCNGIIGSG